MGGPLGVPPGVPWEGPRGTPRGSPGSKMYHLQKAGPRTLDMDKSYYFLQALCPAKTTFCSTKRLSSQNVSVTFPWCIHVYKLIYIYVYTDVYTYIHMYSWWLCPCIVVGASISIFLRGCAA